MKKITTETMEKLAKHIEKCTTYEVRNFDKAECGSYEEDWRLIHTIFDVVVVTDIDTNKSYYLSPFGDDVQILELIPHRGYKLVQQLNSDFYNQAQLFTVAAIAVDRLLRA